MDFTFRSLGDAGGLRPGDMSPAEGDRRRPRPASPVAEGSVFARDEKRSRRREEEEKRVEAEKEKALANVPAGMRVMPEDEREATLAILRANRADVEAKLAAMPIATGQTQTSLRRKAELETRLAEIEDAQRVFQRRVVLVRDE